MLETSTDYDDFAAKVKQSGDMFSIARAEALDREFNTMHMQKALGNNIAAAIYEKRYKTVKNAKNYSELNQVITQLTDETEETLKKVKYASEKVVNLIIKLVDYLTSPRTKKQKKSEDVRFVFKELKNIDPDISWEKIMTDSVYRNCIIFDDARLARLESCFREIIK